METEADLLRFRAANPAPNPSRPAPCRRTNITHMTIEERRLVRDWLDEYENMRRGRREQVRAETQVLPAIFSKKRQKVIHHC